MKAFHDDSVEVLLLYHCFNWLIFYWQDGKIHIENEEEEEDKEQEEEGEEEEGEEEEEEGEEEEGGKEDSENDQSEEESAAEDEEDVAADNHSDLESDLESEEEAAGNKEEKKDETTGNESQNMEGLDPKMEAAKAELPYTFAGKQRTDPEIPFVFREFITSLFLSPAGS